MSLAPGSINVATGEDGPQTRRRIVAAVTMFAIVALAIRWSVEHLGVDAGPHGWRLVMILTVIQWSPAVSVMVVSIGYDPTLRGVGWRRSSWKYELVGCLAPLLYLLPAYIPAWLFGYGKSSSEALGGLGVVARALVPASVPGVVGAAITVVITVATQGVAALGEELGWRGFLVPQLARLTSFTQVSLISGLVWVAWHGPLAGLHYNFDAGRWTAFLLFACQLIGLAFVLAWLRLKSGSIWPAVVLHASHNSFLIVLNGLTRPSPIVGPTLTIAIGVAAVCVWRQGVDLSASPAGLLKAEPPGRGSFFSFVGSRSTVTYHTDPRGSALARHGRATHHDGATLFLRLAPPSAIWNGAHLIHDGYRTYQNYQSHMAGN